MQEKRMQLDFQSQLAALESAEPSTFEILAITAGEGNGWHFTARALQASLPLWKCAECFVDHAWQGHSLRDLAGVCFSPACVENAAGANLASISTGGATYLHSGKTFMHDVPAWYVRYALCEAAGASATLSAASASISMLVDI